MANFWLYVRLQLMVFVFGVIGPIFLIVYFAGQPDPTIKWMYYTGLVVTAIDVLVALHLTENALESRPPAEAHEPQAEEVS